MSVNRTNAKIEFVNEEDFTSIKQAGQIKRDLRAKFETQVEAMYTPKQMQEIVKLARGRWKIPENEELRVSFAPSNANFGEVVAIDKQRTRLLSDAPPKKAGSFISTVEMYQIALVDEDVYLVYAMLGYSVATNTIYLSKPFGRKRFLRPLGALAEAIAEVMEEKIEVDTSPNSGGNEEELV